MGDEFGFVPLILMLRRFGVGACVGFEGSELFVAFVECAFGAGAEGEDAVESFGVGYGEQRVYTFGVGYFGFEAVGALDVPGGEDEHVEQGDLDNVGGVEGVDVGVSKRLELGSFLIVEQDGVFSVEAVFGGVGGGCGFAFWGAVAG